MASGNGRGRNGRNVSCCYIIGTVFLFIGALAAFITSMVLFSIANGNYDYDYEFKYDHCEWSKWYDGYSVNMASWEIEECDEGRQEWDDWVDTKSKLRIAAIVSLVVSLLCGLFGIVLSVLICIRCSKPRAGVVHSQQPTHQTAVTTVHSPPYINQPSTYVMHTQQPVVATMPETQLPISQYTQPAAPPSYNYVTEQNNFAGDAARPPPYNTDEISKQ